MELLFKIKLTALSMVSWSGILLKRLATSFGQEIYLEDLHYYFGKWNWDRFKIRSFALLPTKIFLKGYLLGTKSGRR